jgi:hypothetical protein
MDDATRKAVSKLEREWPAWQIWVVPRVIGGPVWCARLWDNKRKVLNAGTADELAEQLTEAEEGVKG